MYSDRTTDNTAEILGEKARLEKENSALKADIARLRERLALERKVTGGNTFNENLLDAAARHIRALAKSDYDIKQLKEEIRDIYSYITTTENLTWEVLMAKCSDVARSILQKQRGTKVVNSYYKSLRDELRKTRVSLTEEQMQEAKYLYGDKYRDVFFGKIIIAKDAISLDSQWQEWSHMYPELFRDDVTPGDQVSELLSILDSVRESAVTFEKFNDMETVRELATEIYNQYWNVSTVKTTADKYDKQIKKLNFEHRQSMTQMRSDFKKRLDDQKLADRMHYAKVINKVKAQRDADVKRAKELGREHIAELRDRQERNRRIRSITKKALSLNEMLVKNSKDKHIPEVMKNAVAYLIDAIDFSSQQLLGQRGGDYRFQPTNKDISLSKALEQVHQMTVNLDSASITAESINEVFDYVDLPLGFADEILSLSNNVNDILRAVGDNQYVLNEMTADQLTELDHIFRVLKHSVSALNQFHTVAHDAGVADLAGNSMEYADSLGQDKEHSELVEKLRKTVSWNNALPNFVFKRFGEGGVKIFEAMQDGWDKFAFRIKEIIDFAKGVYTEAEVKQWSRQVEEFNIPLPVTAEQAADPDYIPTEQTVKMTHAQIMSLYCLWKREQAKGHILGGGIRVADFEDGKKTVKQTNGINLTEQNVADIIGRLSPREIEVADALQEFMNTTSKQWGNEVSMLRYGYEAFGEENYFPIQTESNDRTTSDKDMNESSLFRLLNMSFTKETNRKANNKLIVNDIFDVFANHASDMAKYNALALPVLDMLKWYNYKENIGVGEDSYTTKSVKASLEAAFGTDAKNYITTLIKDINGEKTGGRDTLGGDLFSKAKVAAVGGNIRVVALQPTAYFRAGALINPKYMTAAFMRAPKVGLAKEHCGIALWKSLGFYDTNIQRDVTSLIKHDATTVDKAVELSMKAAGKADEVTLNDAPFLAGRSRQSHFRHLSGNGWSALPYEGF